MNSFLPRVNHQSKVKLFDSLCEFSHRIHTIVITRSRREVMELDEAKSLANLIKVQHSLQNFELHQCEMCSTAIIQSLQTQSKSLRSICFDYVSFWGWDH